MTETRGVIVWKPGSDLSGRFPAIAPKGVSAEPQLHLPSRIASPRRVTYQAFHASCWRIVPSMGESAHPERDGSTSVGPGSRARTRHRQTPGRHPRHTPSGHVRTGARSGASPARMEPHPASILDMHPLYLAFPSTAFVIEPSVGYARLW